MKDILAKAKALCASMVMYYCWWSSNRDCTHRKIILLWKLFLSNGCETNQKWNLILILGKAIQEVFIQYQRIINDAIMNVIKPGQHGSTLWESSCCCGCHCSTWGGSRENLSVNADRLGIILRKGLNDIASGIH
jgi:ornithine--oxo-acid transaminase